MPKGDLVCGTEARQLTRGLVGRLDRRGAADDGGDAPASPGRSGPVRPIDEPARPPPSVGRCGSAAPQCVGCRRRTATRRGGPRRSAGAQRTALPSSTSSHWTAWGSRRTAGKPASWAASKALTDRESAIGTGSRRSRAGALVESARSPVRGTAPRLDCGGSRARSGGPPADVDELAAILTRPSRNGGVVATEVAAAADHGGETDGCSRPGTARGPRGAGAPPGPGRPTRSARTASGCSRRPHRAPWQRSHRGGSRR